MYVPSTTLDQPISESDFKSRIDETQEKLSELFGGFTTVDASGGYLSQQDGVISEPVIVVSSWATVRDYQSKMGDLERFLKQKKDDWGQEVIGFEFENDFFMYPAFRAEEINLGAEDDIKLFYEGIYDNDGGFGDGNEMKSYSVVSKKITETTTKIQNGILVNVMCKVVFHVSLMNILISLNSRKAVL